MSFDILCDETIPGCHYLNSPNLFNVSRIRALEELSRALIGGGGGRAGWLFYEVKDGKAGGRKR